MADTHDQLSDHNYDGIQEYDNPTPGWWHAIFFITILYSIGYAVWVHMSPLWPNPAQRFERAEARALEIQFAELRTIPMGEEKLRRIMGQEKWLGMGAGIFEAHCILCHKADGSGLVGPNLTDEHYKNLTTLEGFIGVIADGAADGAMPSHRTLLNENEIALVAAYAASLRGKALPGKEPEGDVIAPFPPPITDDPPPPADPAPIAGG